jgi:hypothetical protein
MSPEQIEKDIERTREDLRQDVDALQEKLSPTQAAKRSVARVGDSVSQARDALMGTAEDNVARPQESVAGVGDRISRGARGNPIAVGLGAFAIGWLVSSLIPTSRTEQRTAGNLRDSDVAASVVGPVADTARTVAENAGESAKQAATEVGRGAQSSATSVAGSVGHNGSGSLGAGTA